MACVRAAWAHSTLLAVLMAERFKHSSVLSEIERLVHAHPATASKVPEALDFLLGSGIRAAVRPNLVVREEYRVFGFSSKQQTSQHLIHWAPVSPVKVLRYFLPAFNREPLVLQYAMRVLEQHPIDLVFFYIPQVVQALRTDPLRKLHYSLQHE